MVTLEETQEESVDGNHWSKPTLQTGDDWSGTKPTKQDNSLNTETRVPDQSLDKEGPRFILGLEPSEQTPLLNGGTGLEPSEQFSLVNQGSEPRIGAGHQINGDSNGFSEPSKKKYLKYSKSGTTPINRNNNIKCLYL